MRRTALELMLSSALAALIAVLAGGAVEAFGHARGPLQSAASIGFLALLAAPLGLVMSALGRLVLRAWRPAELAEALRDPATGGAPRLAAWAVVLLLAAIGMAAVVLQGMNWVTGASSARVVHALSAPIFAVGAAVLLGALSRPAVGGLTRMLARLDRAMHAQAGVSPFRPGWVAAGTLAAGAGLLWLAWSLTIRPHVGHVDLSYLPTIVLWLVALALTPLLWRVLRGRRARLAVLTAATGMVALCLAAALHLRHSQLLSMLQIWGEAPIAGLAIDRLYDVEELRGELNVASLAPPARPGAPNHDIVLITIDTMRADRTPPYGGRARMPALAELAEQALVFEWAFSPGNVTRRSLPSMSIGVTAPRLRGRVAGWALKLDPRHILLAERLRAGGYDTAGFFCCTSQFGAEHRLGLTRGIGHVFIDKDSEVLAREADRWLDAREQRALATGTRRPLFLWFHFIEPHGWQKSHPVSGEARTHARRYDLSLGDVDLALRAVLDSVWKPAERRARTVVVVTSDHGEALGDHGHKTHASSLYNAEIRVPLIIAGPGIAPGRVPRPVGLHDLAPTLLDLAGYVPPGMPVMDGVSLGPVIRGEARTDLEAGEAYAAMIPDRSVSTERRALVVGRHKLIWRPDRDEVELYDIVQDPDEKKDLAKSQPELVARLKARLAERRALDTVDPF